MLDLRHTFCADCDSPPKQTVPSAVMSFADHELTVIKHIWGNVKSLVGSASRQWVQFSRRRFNIAWEHTAAILAVSLEGNPEANVKNKDGVSLAANQQTYETDEQKVSESSSPLVTGNLHIEYSQST